MQEDGQETWKISHKQQRHLSLLRTAQEELIANIHQYTGVCSFGRHHNLNFQKTILEATILFP